MLESHVQGQQPVGVCVLDRVGVRVEQRAQHGLGGEALHRKVQRQAAVGVALCARSRPRAQQPQDCLLGRLVGVQVQARGRVRGWGSGLGRALRGSRLGVSPQPQPQVSWRA